MNLPDKDQLMTEAEAMCQIREVVRRYKLDRGADFIAMQHIEKIVASSPVSAPQPKEE